MCRGAPQGTRGPNACVQEAFRCGSSMRLPVAIAVVHEACICVCIVCGSGNGARGVCFHGAPGDQCTRAQQRRLAPAKLSSPRLRVLSGRVALRGPASPAGCKGVDTPCVGLGRPRTSNCPACAVSGPRRSHCESLEPQKRVLCIFRGPRRDSAAAEPSTEDSRESAVAAHIGLTLASRAAAHFKEQLSTPADNVTAFCPPWVCPLATELRLKLLATGRQTYS